MHSCMFHWGLHPNELTVTDGLNDRAMVVPDSQCLTQQWSCISSDMLVHASRSSKVQQRHICRCEHI
jgi:hypothetical protein